MSPSKAIIAFLGTGLMGRPMAARLIGGGHSLRVWNRSPARAAPLSDDGAIICGTPAEAARGADYVCLCLTDAIALEAVLFGAGGVASCLSDSAAIIDFSTIGPEAAGRMARQLHAACGAAWLDCPVSGGVIGATEGTLTIFAGGDHDKLNEVASILGLLASRVTHMGSVGSGQAAKLCNQLIVASNLLAIAEALALAQRLSIEAKDLPQTFAGGFADSKPLQLFGPRMVEQDKASPPLGAIQTMHKDIDLILKSAADCGAKVPLVAKVGEMYAALMSEGAGTNDLSSLIQLYGNQR